MLRDGQKYGTLCVCLCFTRIPISICSYMGKNNITCRLKEEEEQNIMKVGFPSAALWFLHLVGFTSLRYKNEAKLGKSSKR